jgi:hypothetical protein
MVVCRRGGASTVDGDGRVHDTNRRPDDDASRRGVRACRTLSLLRRFLPSVIPFPQTLIGGRCSRACLLVVIIFLLYFLLNRST